MDCWEFKACTAQVRDACPAYPERGLDCWRVTGTLCEGGTIRKKTAAEKIDHCRACDFYVRHANKF